MLEAVRGGASQHKIVSKKQKDYGKEAKAEKRGASRWRKGLNGCLKVGLETVDKEAEKCGGERTTLFNTFLDGDRRKAGRAALGRSKNILIKSLNLSQESWGDPKMVKQNSPEERAVDTVKGLL